MIIFRVVNESKKNIIAVQTFDITRILNNKIVVSNPKWKNVKYFLEATVCVGFADLIEGE